MPLLTATNVHYAIGQHILLDGVSFAIEPGERVGLVGPNGSGKTTLMRLFTGRIAPDSGEVAAARGARVGYLSQEPELDPDRTLRDEAASAFAELERAHAELDAVYAAMAEVGSAPGPGLDRLLKRQEELEKRIEAAGGYAVDHRIEAVLHGLGFADEQFSVPVRALSGGQKGRLALAKLLLESPDAVLLDEPTNHLDIAGREWLEEFLVGQFRGAVLMVSHDRYMLDRVVHRIVELERGVLVEYPGNYTAFREIRAERRLTRQRAYEKQQDRFRKEQAFIDRYRAGQRAKQAQGRETRLEREMRSASLERPVEFDTFRYTLPPAPRSGELAVVVRGAGKWYDLTADTPEGAKAGSRLTLFRDLDLTISRGERWGVIGPNGAGKTTLVRAILGQIPLNEGGTKLGANIAVGYFSQQPDEADPTLTVWQYLQAVIRRENPEASLSEQQARDLAGAFLFSGSDQEKPLSVLSGGERGRARLAGLMASAKNLLILDEPTNHLDIPSAERLEELMRPPGEESSGGYGGTFILISHDRALIDATCDHLLVLDGKGNVEVFHGNYSQWHERQLARECERQQAEADAARRRDAAARRQAPTGTTSAGRSGPSAQAKGGLSWMPLDRLEREIEAATGRIKEVDRLLGLEEVYRDAGRCQDLLTERDQIQVQLERLEEEWLRRADDGG